MGRIECGGGDGGEPVLSPPGWLEFSPAAWPLRSWYIHGRAGDDVRRRALFYARSEGMNFGDRSSIILFFPVFTKKAQSVPS